MTYARKTRQYQKKNPRRKFKTPPGKPDYGTYRDIWRAVDGAIRQTFLAHPEYVPYGHLERSIRYSLNKRIVGIMTAWAQTQGSAEQSASERHDAGLLQGDSASPGPE